MRGHGTILCCSRRLSLATSRTGSRTIACSRPWEAWTEVRGGHCRSQDHGGPGLLGHMGGKISGRWLHHRAVVCRLLCLCGCYRGRNLAQLLSCLVNVRCGRRGAKYVTINSRRGKENHEETSTRGVKWRHQPIYLWWLSFLVGAHTLYSVQFLCRQNTQ